MKLTLPWGIVGQVAFVMMQAYLGTHFAKNVLTPEDIDVVRIGLFSLQAALGVTQHMANPQTGQIESPGNKPHN